MGSEYLDCGVLKYLVSRNPILTRGWITSGLGFLWMALNVVQNSHCCFKGVDGSSAHMWTKPMRSNKNKDKQTIFFWRRFIRSSVSPSTGAVLSVKTPGSSGSFWMVTAHHTNGNGIVLLTVPRWVHTGQFHGLLLVVKVAGPYRRPPGSHTEGAQAFSVSEIWHRDLGLQAMYDAWSRGVVSVGYNAQFLQDCIITQSLLILLSCAISPPQPLASDTQRNHTWFVFDFNLHRLYRSIRAVCD